MLVDINQSNDSHVNVENITFFMKTLIHPHQLKDQYYIYILNELQIHAFETFTQILQYVGGVAST